MTGGKERLKKGDLVLVQPMRYCYTFTSGSIENLNTEGHTKDSPNHTAHHWTEDGFKARIISIETLLTPHNEEEYVEVKLFGRGRKHFVKRNEEKTKVVWVQRRLVSKCKEE